MFGAHLKFDLSAGSLPIVTLRKGYVKLLFTELAWLLKGNTDTTLLSEQGVKVWDKNTTREALDSYGFTDRPVGSIGPSYGF